MGMIMTRAERILEAAREQTDDCIIVADIRPTSNGYSYVWHRGAKIGSHRLVCIEHHGPPPGIRDAAHSCGQSACVNPRHLRWATRSENHADKRIHGTQPAGETQPFAKLTNTLAADLRRRYQAGELTARDVARISGLNTTNAHQLVSGRSYKDAV